ncbi:sugar ABC transporter permease [Sphaerisporangium siamense]|uniref:Glucose/mannose transport system permease protein n=1 Tax=Sphaerisporangium siamense TaxID=795645 RepID=A0A7W7D6W9_9ACTN|nr:sugar ABC transporter permease [Sphaerisporangium siamense]MBB4701370.1 glucose/mannose transport system permease protein [Sphaerisporangium siamense]GII85494.1 sugar ABC transporter permease [Sphaerisporangium siamense]
MSRLRRPRLRRWLPGLLLVTPSIVLIAVFVYGMLGWNFRLAMTDQHDEISEGRFVGLENFVALWDQERWGLSVKHAIVFTVVFVGGALALGWLLAFLMEKGIRGEGGFRTVYLFPMAISFVATGVVWRWLMNSGQGEQAVGLNRLFQAVGLGFLENGWFRGEDWGMAAMAIPAIWQMSGYVMALFLAGFRGVPEELREAARVDGCREWQVYRYVVFPFLRPVTLSALIILGHISLKVFDLIVSVSGKQIITDVPAVFMWVAVFDAHDPAKGATIAAYIVLAVAVFVVPYLIWNARREKRS